MISSLSETGTRVYSIGSGSLSVLPYASERLYLAYPCQPHTDRDQYEYIVATPAFSRYKGSFFDTLYITACHNDTSFSIRRMDVIHHSRAHVTLDRGGVSVYRIRYNGFNGAEIISNKPLTVVSSYAASTPRFQLETLTQQILPTFTWGTEFLLTPLRGRKVGQYYQVTASQTDTRVVRTCNSISTTHTLASRLTPYNFYTDPNTYCSLVSNKPVNVLQFQAEYPTVSTIPSLDHYGNQLTFYSLSSSSNRISVSSLPEFFQPNSIRLDDQPINATWTPIHNGRGSVVGYSCDLSVAGRMVHTVSHDRPGGRVTVLVYGYSYAYNAGLRYSTMASGRVTIHIVKDQIRCLFINYFLFREQGSFHLLILWSREWTSIFWWCSVSG